MNLLQRMQNEAELRLRGGLYHQTQVTLAYNTNRIEGSRLSQEQTRFIFETNTVDAPPGESLSVDDIVETVNHFACFDYLLRHAEEPLSQEHMRTFHRLLKTGTGDARQPWFRVGDYKARPNMAGDTKTTPPARVAAEMEALLADYHARAAHTLTDLAAFHVAFERIHPFQDGNGRVGRLVLFKECLARGIMPFVIEDTHKLFYYRGLREFDREPGYLLDTCRAAQDAYAAQVAYFYPEMG